MALRDVFELLAGEGAPGLQDALRWLDWGPTTDDVLCFLVPSEGNLHLVWRIRDEPDIRSVLVDPIDLADLIVEVVTILKEMSGRIA